MKRRILLICFVVAICVGAMAQRRPDYSPFGGEIEPPKAMFHSTSTLVVVNSAYSSRPLLGEDGLATTSTAAHLPSLRKDGDVPIIEIPDDDDDWLPVGDAVIPLLLMLLVYVERKKKILFKRA